MDSGASDHITRDIETITVHNKYKGKDQVHGADGTGMSINNIGHSIIHTPCKNLYLKNILHVPSARKNLLSVKRLASDNKAFIEFHPHSFLLRIKPRRKSFIKVDARTTFIP
jgi:histone deacetylase 1/2